MFPKILRHLRQQYLGGLALFIVLGGTSYAVATGSIDSREIKNDTVRSKDLRNNDVRSKDVRDFSLTAQDFALGQLPAGTPGPPGEPGSARAFAYIDKDGVVDPTRSKEITQANVSKPNSVKYCISGLSFTPRNAVATFADPYESPYPEVFRITLPAGDGCPNGPDGVLVQALNLTANDLGFGAVPQAFFVLIN